MSVHKIIVGGIVTIIVGVILAATTWNFAAVAEMPEKYVTREENTREHVKIEHKLDKIYDHLIKESK